jgi:hypothetical protein
VARRLYLLLLWRCAEETVSGEQGVVASGESGEWRVVGGEWSVVSGEW